MKRDDELIRALMLDLEVATQMVTGDHAVAGYGRDQVAYHLALILKAGFAEGPQPIYSSSGGDPTIPTMVLVLRLTPEAHDFIATIRDDAIWAKVKERTGKVAGGVTLAILKEVGVAVVKQHLGLH